MTWHTHPLLSLADRFQHGSSFHIIGHQDEQLVLCNFVMFIIIVILRQAAKKWQPDFEKYFEEMMDRLTGRSSMHSFRLRKPSGTSPTGPRIDGFRFSMGRHVCGSSNPVAEVRETSCGALDLELEAEEEAAHESHLARPPTGGTLVSTGSDPAAARSTTGAGLCVSFH